jgi:methylated-DNA-[protein]-cysteine S-methyltransferase
MHTDYTLLNSPLGDVLVAWSERGLERIGIGEHVERYVDMHWRLDPGPDCEAVRQLRSYFRGERTKFDLPLVLDGTAFQCDVWRALPRIPFGETASYGEIGRWVGKPRASRAVGMACGRNPLPIVIPCHRVIGADGRLVGFGGGIDLKRRLLEFERAARSARSEAVETR